MSNEMEAGQNPFARPFMAAEDGCGSGSTGRRTQRLSEIAKELGLPESHFLNPSPVVVSTSDVVQAFTHDDQFRSLAIGFLQIVDLEMRNAIVRIVTKMGKNSGYSSLTLDQPVR